MQLYEESRLADLKKQISRRQWLVLALVLVFLALVAVTLVLDNGKENRPVLATTLLVILDGCAVIFFWDMTIRPLRVYAKHMDECLHGRTHQVGAVFDRVGAEDSVIDGHTFRDLIFLGEADKHGDRERLFYWDMELPLPDFRQGETLLLTYCDRFLTAYERL